jgi:hypothetical protein
MVAVYWIQDINQRISVDKLQARKLSYHDMAEKNHGVYFFGDDGKKIAGVMRPEPP